MQWGHTLGLLHTILYYYTMLAQLQTLWHGILISFPKCRLYGVLLSYISYTPSLYVLGEPSLRLQRTGSTQQLCWSGRALLKSGHMFIYLSHMDGSLSVEL